MAGGWVPGESARLPGPAQREGMRPPAEHARAPASLAKVKAVSLSLGVSCATRTPPAQQAGSGAPWVPCSCPSESDPCFHFGNQLLEASVALGSQGHLDGKGTMCAQKGRLGLGVDRFVRNQKFLVCVQQENEVKRHLSEQGDPDPSFLFPPFSNKLFMEKHIFARQC